MAGAAGPHALLEALLSGDAGEARRLLQGDFVDTLIRAGPCGLTALHAAVAGGCAGALPALVEAGVPLDAALPAWYKSADGQQFLDMIGAGDGPQTCWLSEGYTALAVAAR